ncbi:nucleotidyltransferase domain-containing protein [Dietzia sp. NPDC055877]
MPPPLPQPSDAGPLPPDEFRRWYGGWDPLDPSTTADFLDGFDRPWWIVGGWALEKFTGVSREHEDMDISIDAGDAEHLRVFLANRGWTTWNADSGWLRPFDHRFRDIRPTSGIWVRADARSPWVLDVPLTPFRDGLWVNKKLPEQAMPLERATWVDDDGLRYLQPEIVLFMKAAQVRDKDVSDAHTYLPLLDASRRDWLRESVSRMDPSHPWADRGAQGAW